jgi:hypothetical protein
MAAQKVVFLEAGISWTPKQHNTDCATTRNNQNLDGKSEIDIKSEGA